MKRRKNLERAIVLGLLLSTGVYGSAWAANVPFIENESYDNNGQVFSEDVIVAANNTDEEEDAIGNIILRDENQYTVTISTTNGNIEFEKNDGSGILVADGIASGTTVTLSASGDIAIDAKNGIQANAKPREDNNISVISLTAKNNKITASDVGIYSTGGVDVLLISESNEIISTGNYGIQATESSDGDLTLIATNGNNTVKAEQGTAIRANGEKVITLNTSGDNIVIGGVYGIENTQTDDTIKSNDNIYTNLDAANNIVYGADSAIKSDGVGITDIKASESNTIGQYTDESANIHTSNNGIRVSEGTVNITAENENKIFGISNGIILTDEDTQKEVNVVGKYNTINVENATTNAAGINFNNVSNGAVNVNNGLDNDGNPVYADSFNVNVSSTGDAMGLKFDGASGNEVNVYANDIIIKTDSSKRGNAIWFGNYSDDNKINLNANGEINLSSSFGGYSSGAVIWFAGKNNTLTINGGSNTITSQDSKVGIEGIVLSGSGNDISITAKSGDNKIYSQNVAIDLSDSTGTFKLDAAGSNNITSTNNNGLSISNISEVNMTAKGNNTIDAQSDGISFTTATSSGKVNLVAANNIIEAGGDGIYLTEGTIGTVNLNATSGNNEITADKNHGIAVNSSFITLTANNGKNIIKSLNPYNKWDSAIYAVNKGSAVSLTATQNEIYAGKYGINSGANKDGGIVTLTATTGDNLIETDNLGVRSVNSGEVTVSANNSNLITGSMGAIAAYDTGNVTVTATSGDNKFIATGSGEGWALDAESASTISSNAVGKNNQIIADQKGIFAGEVDTEVLVTAGVDNIISADSQNILTDDLLTVNNGYGNSYAIDSEAGASVKLQAANANKVSGAVYASGAGTNVDISKLEGTASTFNRNAASEVSNYVYSAAVIDGAGDIDTSEGSGEKFEGKKFLSSLYAEDGANIELTGENYIGTWADNTLPEYLERTVWAYSKEDNVASTIKITGAAQIGTDRYEISPNSADVAIAAGTATDLNKEKVDGFSGKRSTVTVEYDNFADGDFSSISGDILSAYAGKVDIYSNNDEAKLYVKGNLLAGNNGILDIDLGNGGYFEGRTDDYQDAGTATDKGTVANEDHLDFYDPAFSSTIFSSGKINLDMGQGSHWNVTGQSWVTSLSGEGVIDMRNDNENLSSVTTNANETATATDNNSHAVHIGTLTGKHTFVMDLDDTSHEISDMLYIKDEANSSGTHTVFLNSVAGLENMEDGDKLRFATVNAGEEQLAFVGEYKGENGYTGSRSRAMLNDIGFNNVAFEIKNETYSTSDAENAGYNGKDFDTTKPGNEYVNTEYGNGATNWYITRNSSGDEISDGGKTILNMSRANYSNAIYMDRLNKRLGEARYINDDPEEDEGMWVRVRHDRIGKDDAFRSQNTMYQLGYDKRQECDNGKRRVGFAVDYMHGDTGYSDIAGKGEIDRYGLWLYDTWTGNKGHYVDYVAKWGHLDNEFEIYNSREKLDGDYSNNVFSISAEYGRKKDMGSDWYFEPQAQLQLARVTGADYTTSQGTKVSVDGINSLIGRAGFRIGKDFGEQKQSTLYFKADVLHEFLGDQTIRALDGTTNGWQSVDYENQGTWYDIGIGYAAMLSQSTYAFIDLEQSFGNDNDDTYQINAGVRWTF